MQKIINFIYSHKAVSIIIIAAALIVVLFLAAFTFDFYPIAFVNGKVVMSYDYNRGYSLAYNYYSYFNQGSLKVDDAQMVKSLKEATFEGLIDDVFVDQKLNQEMKPSELQDKITERVSGMISDPKFNQTLSEVVKVSQEDIKKYFLENQAKYEILDGRLSLENKNSVDWLIEQRKAAKVTILMPGFKWTGEKIEVQ